MSAPGQWGDHFEQFAWSHSIEWGYYKHPPLPTWILAGSIAFFGSSVQSATVLAALCSLGTGFFTFLVARELLGRQIALLTLLFWGLQQPFSNRAFLFNHNTVMMLCISAAAWSVLKALSRPTERRWWLVAGILAGLSLLSKYQSAIPLAGMVMAAGLSGELASRRARFGLLAATLMAMLVFLPHVAWIFQHGMSTLAYAAQEGKTLSWPERAWNVTSFLAQQIRLLFPALFLAGLLWIAKRKREVVPEATGGVDRRRRAWFFGLIVFPLMITLLTSPVFGLKLQNHWGYQVFQFASLWLAWQFRTVAASERLSWLAIVCAALLQAIFISLSLIPVKPGNSRQDSLYPARALADAVRRDWQKETQCPLSYVVGPTLEAGIISVYNGGTAAVLENGDYLKSPWIKPENLRRRGAIFVAYSAGELPTEGVTRTGSLDVSSASPQPSDHVYWAVIAPASCSGS